MCIFWRYTAEGIDIGLDGPGKVSNGNEGVPAVSRIAPEALLGQSFLGQRLLRGHNRFDAEMIRKYVRHQEKAERQQEQLRLDE
jgi:hypothetical protein